MTLNDELSIVRIQLEQAKSLIKQLEVIIQKQDAVIESYKDLLNYMKEHQS